MNAKFKESTQCYMFFYQATAIATVVYHKKVAKTMDIPKTVVTFYKIEQPSCTPSPEIQSKPPPVICGLLNA